MAMTSTPIEIIEEWAAQVRVEALNTDKVWAAAYTASGHYLAVWGRRSTAYSTQTKPFANVSGAAAHFRAKRVEKLRRGYTAVPFGHADYGAIPSFADAPGAGLSVPVTGPQRITLEGVLAELAAVPALLRRAGPRLPDILFAYTQTRIKAELLLAAGRLAEAEHLACLDALAAARAAVGAALVA